MMGPQTMSLHGNSLSYIDSGTGEVVLFVHGLLGSHRNWRTLIDRIDDTHRVIVPDLFGHGSSAKPEGDYSLGAHAGMLRDLIDALGVEKVTLVGHSLGGGISLQFCYLFPERVERLVLVGSGGLGREVIAALRAATLPGAEWVLPIIASTRVRGGVETIGRGLARVGWRASHDMRAAWEGFTALSDADSRRAFLATTRAVIDPGGAERHRQGLPARPRRPARAGRLGNQRHGHPGLSRRASQGSDPGVSRRAVRRRWTLPTPR